MYKMAVLSKIKPHSDAVDYFKELPFYNKPIKKPKVKRLNVESIESEYTNISIYRPLSGTSYVDLPVELRSPRKGPINIKNKDKKCFLWCHVRHISPSKEHPERTFKVDKKIAKTLDYDETEFPVQDKDFSKIETKNNICINVFRYENELVFPIYVSDQKFEDSIGLLLLTDDDNLINSN